MHTFNFYPDESDEFRQWEVWKPWGFRGSQSQGFPRGSGGLCLRNTSVFQCQANGSSPSHIPNTTAILWTQGRVPWVLYTFLHQWWRSAKSEPVGRPHPPALHCAARARQKSWGSRPVGSPKEDMNFAAEQEGKSEWVKTECAYCRGNKFRQTKYGSVCFSVWKQTHSLCAEKAHPWSKSLCKVDRRLSVHILLICSSKKHGLELNKVNPKSKGWFPCYFPLLTYVAGKNEHTLCGI